MTDRPPICPRRFEMTKALAAAFASRASIPSSNVDARAHGIVLLADVLVSKLEELEAGILPERHDPDSYQDL